ncbi:hypothetical protein PROFUN_13381 [Planoprotostelium fungivorum]|uniref:Uncharacterized protein n=1 Tax=Planoprotostelium fungivorum TaxID=1890364 RepID=A0A2P6MZR4_9EUKA|nr:hypothetical protein PROFUN_13381 [Planoprotostelium fungivorum]
MLPVAACSTYHTHLQGPTPDHEGGGILEELASLALLREFLCVWMFVGIPSVVLFFGFHTYHRYLSLLIDLSVESVNIEVEPERPHGPARGKVLLTWTDDFTTSSLLSTDKDLYAVHYSTIECNREHCFLKQCRLMRVLSKTKEAIFFMCSSCEQNNEISGPGAKLSNPQ